MNERSLQTASLLVVLVAFLSGCQAIHPGAPPLDPPTNLPRELAKVSLPPYTIEPPDILAINAIRIVPRAPYYLNALDVLEIRIPGAPPEVPIPDTVVIEPGGTVNLGVPYGRVLIAGLTVEQATDRMQRHLAPFVRQPGVSLNLVQISSTQQISGEHLVGPDGTVNLGIYGNVAVVGMTVPEARTAIEMHLSQFLERPLVAVDVFSYNSKVYYVITQGAGLGDGVNRFPVTGNETVLDAISQINGLTSVSSKRIWVARPVPGTHDNEILHVDWHALTACGEADTNFQILPGDRVFVAEDKLVATDTFVGKALAPFERIFGFISLGTRTISDLRFFHIRGRFTGNGGAIIVP